MSSTVKVSATGRGFLPPAVQRDALGGVFPVSTPPLCRCSNCALPQIPASTMKAV